MKDTPERSEAPTRGDQHLSHMEALFSAAREAVTGIVGRSVATHQYKPECLKLARYTSKVALVLAEIELVMAGEEDAEMAGAWARILACQAAADAAACLGASWHGQLGSCPAPLGRSVMLWSPLL